MFTTVPSHRASYDVTGRLRDGSETARRSHGPGVATHRKHCTPHRSNAGRTPAHAVLAWLSPTWGSFRCAFPQVIFKAVVLGWGACLPWVRCRIGFGPGQGLVACLWSLGQSYFAAVPEIVLPQRAAGEHMRCGPESKYMFSREQI